VFVVAMWTLHWGQCATPLLGSASTASTIPWALNVISAYLGSMETQPLVFPAEVILLDNQVSNKAAHLLHSRSKQSHTLVTHKWQIKPHFLHSSSMNTTVSPLSLSTSPLPHSLLSPLPCSFSFPPIPFTLISHLLPTLLLTPLSYSFTFPQFPSLLSLGFLSPSSSLPHSLSVQSQWDGGGL